MIPRLKEIWYHVPKFKSVLGGIGFKPRLDCLSAEGFVHTVNGMDIFFLTVPNVILKHVFFFKFYYS